MKKINLRKRDYIGIFLIFILGYYCLYLNFQVNTLGDMLNEYPFSSRKQLEDGHKANEIITLYYAGPNAEDLIGEERNIKELTPLKAVQALIEGPRRKDLTRALPIELEVTNVSIEDGVAHVYIHESVPLDRHGNYGSSTATLYIMNSISATLILHKPFDIEKVKLEGDINDLLQGVDTDMPFGLDMNLINK